MSIIHELHPDTINAIKRLLASWGKGLHDVFGMSKFTANKTIVTTGGLTLVGVGVVQSTDGSLHHKYRDPSTGQLYLLTSDGTLHQV